jgi:hypothetical protein
MYLARKGWFRNFIIFWVGILGFSQNHYKNMIFL